MTRSSLFLLFFLLLKAGSLSIEAEKRSEPIPLRNPEAGERRLAWWLRCWLGNVVVEGTIEFTKTKADRIKIEISAEALKKHYGNQKARNMQNDLSLFYIGDLVIDKMLFAAPGLELSDGNVNAMISG